MPIFADEKGRYCQKGFWQWFLSHRCLCGVDIYRFCALWGGIFFRYRELYFLKMHDERLVACIFRDNAVSVRADRFFRELNLRWREGLLLSCVLPPRKSLYLLLS